MSDVYKSDSKPDVETGERLQDDLRGAKAGHDRRQSNQDVEDDRRRDDRRTHPRFKK